MNNFISQQRISYVLDHLNQHVDISLIKTQFIFLQDPEEIKQYNNKIIFLLSEKNLDLNNVIYNKDIPILFPVLDKETSPFSIQGSNLIFNHDMLKSVFYLLSGYQELNPEYKGKFNRFPFELSIQHKLNITHKPIVNYYFDFIISGLKEYSIINKFEQKLKSNFENFGFFLTHDIDKVDTYSVYDLIYYFKVLLGISKNNLSFTKKVKKFIEYIYNFLFTSKNPSWDFDFLRSVEEENQLKSAFYFLPKDLKHQDAYYSFNEKRLQKLFKKLKNENCEIGIHGTNRSATNLKYLKENINELENAASIKIDGIRQHRLIFDMNTTPYLHEKAQLIYDTSLSFAEHEGFRNSYCHPFKLYNFKEERPFNTWEIPLNVMDATLLEYRKLNMQDAFESVKKLINEVAKFNGTFTLLWHNGYFDETLYPGIKVFYVNLLRYIRSLHAASFLGNQINKING